MESDPPNSTADSVCGCPTPTLYIGLLVIVYLDLLIVEWAIYRILAQAKTVTLSAINRYPRLLQAMVARGVAGAVVNTKQCGTPILLLKFFCFQILMIQTRMTSKI